jgi:hypothetical protein
MSTSPHNGRNQVAPGARDGEKAGQVSRRTMLAGAMATTAMVAVPIDGPAYAQSVDSDPDMMAFLVLSTALTGLKVVNLAPEFTGKDKQGKAVPTILEADPGVDPFNIKNDYFKVINLKDPAGFGKLLKIARDNSGSATAIITAANNDDDTKYLARSIVLLWYLGSWYEPADLKKFSAPGAPSIPVPSKVVCAKAYTQGRVWQIAQAHPMGYSNLQFGYWSREPIDPNDQNVRSDLGFITATIP